MKYSLKQHPYFKLWENPSNGIGSYILEKRIAPIQQPFYFTNPSISPNGEYLWFYTAFPPNPQKMLGCVCLNPEMPWIRSYPQAGFSNASPMVAPDSSGIYFTCNESVMYMNLDGEIRTVLTLPEEYIGHRYLDRLATHLSMSCDNKYFILDGQIGNVFFVALGNISTGEVKILHEFSYCHDHAQFSPTDPKLFLLPRDWMRDPVTGRYIFMEMRLWLMDTEQTIYRNLRPDIWEGHSNNTAHEWWSMDGKVCYVDYAEGVYQCDPYTLNTEHVWKRPLCHAHCDPSGRYYCADQSPYAWSTSPVQILFYDRLTCLETEIVSALPFLPMIKQSFNNRNYHLDPHPHFSPDGSAVVYMTTVMNQIDVAITPIDQLKKEK